MSLFSLLIFSITKNCPRMNGMYAPADHSTLVPARMGWTQLTGRHPSLPFHTRLRTQGRMGTLFSGGCRDPGYLDNRGFVRPRRRRFSSTARGGLSLSRVPCQGHSHPTLCFFEIQTKGCFSMFKENKKKKKSKNQTQHLISYKSRSSLLLSFPSIFLSMCPLFVGSSASLCFSLSLVGILRRTKGWATSDPGNGAVKPSGESAFPIMRGAGLKTLSSLPSPALHGFPGGPDWQGGALWGGSSSLTMQQ